MSGLHWETDEQSRYCSRNTMWGWIEGTGINKIIRGCMNREAMQEKLITIT